jgi:hypothetical protein
MLNFQAMLAKYYWMKSLSFGKIKTNRKKSLKSTQRASLKSRKGLLPDSDLSFPKSGQEKRIVVKFRFPGANPLLL